MNKYIEINNGVLINTKDIRRVEFISDDVYLGLLKKDSDGEYFGSTDFEYAKIIAFDNQVFTLTIELLPPELGENEEQWRKRNMAYIGQSMEDIWDILKPFKVDGKEYSD